MPDLTGTFVADHAGTNGSPWAAGFCKELTVRGVCNSPEHLIADTGRMFRDVLKDDTKLFLGIVLFKFLP